MLVLASAHPAVSQPDEVPVRTFVTRTYFEGLPYHQARTYGADVLPELHAMLYDESLEAYWPNIVGMIGYLGQPASSGELLAFLYRQQGDISGNRFRAVLEVMPALGHIAAAGDRTAIDQLIARTFRENWDDPSLNLRFGRYEKAVLGEVLGRKAIQGLGISGHPEARSRLTEMQFAGKAPSDWSDNVSEALAMQERVAAGGIGSLFAR